MVESPALQRHLLEAADLFLIQIRVRLLVIRELNLKVELPQYRKRRNQNSIWIPASKVLSIQVFNYFLRLC